MGEKQNRGEPTEWSESSTAHEAGQIQFLLRGLIRPKLDDIAARGGKRRLGSALALWSSDDSETETAGTPHAFHRFRPPVHLPTELKTVDGGRRNRFPGP